MMDDDDSSLSSHLIKYFRKGIDIGFDVIRMHPWLKHIAEPKQRDKT